MKTNRILSICLITLAAVVCNVRATDIGGIIDVNTTWSLANSPYNLTSDIQIAYGVVLTIQPGVVVNGGTKAGPINYIQAWGTLNAEGTTESRITFNYTAIASATGAPPAEPILIITHSVINGGWITLQNMGGTLILQDSLLNDISNFAGVTVIGPDANCYVERNIFDDVSHLVVYPNASTTVYIRNNVFYRPSVLEPAASVYCSSSVGPERVIVQYNSFLSTDKLALQITTNAQMTATQNYWNTMDAGVIDSMIWDRNDDLGIIHYIDYTPILTEPHPNTPEFNPEYVLTVKTEPNDVNTVTPSVGDHNCGGVVAIGVDQFVDCPDVYNFDHWEGEVVDANAANTTVFMDGHKTITAVFLSTRQCGDECHPYPAGDVDKDCRVDFFDISLVAGSWLECTEPECD